MPTNRRSYVAEKSTKQAQASASLSLASFRSCAAGWLLDGEIRQLSPRTLEERQSLTERLLWFAVQREYASLGVHELRAFLAYLSTAHESGARWDNEQNAKNTRPVKPVTVAAYHRNLSVFFSWCVNEGELALSPMARIAPPRVLEEQVQPFTDAQVEALLAAARRSRERARNVAIVYFLLDTGARASELCDLTCADVDIEARRCWVCGKGRKKRLLPFGRVTSKHLWTYHSQAPARARFFVASQGALEDQALTPNGLHQLIQRLGAVASLSGVRASPHTFRHTFAISFLRAGGNVFTLKELLGHTTLAMVNRYVRLADADIEAQHRAHSPADWLGRRRG